MTPVNAQTCLEVQHYSDDDSNICSCVWNNSTPESLDTYDVGVLHVTDPSDFENVYDGVAQSLLEGEYFPIAGDLLSSTNSVQSEKSFTYYREWDVDSKIMYIYQQPIVDSSNHVTESRIHYQYLYKDNPKGMVVPGVIAPHNSIALGRFETYIFKNPTEENEYFSCTTDELGYFISANPELLYLEKDSSLSDDTNDDSTFSHSGYSCNRVTYESPANDTYYPANRCSCEFTTDDNAIDVYDIGLFFGESQSNFSGFFDNAVHLLYEEYSPVTGDIYVEYEDNIQPRQQFERYNEQGEIIEIFTHQTPIVSDLFYYLIEPKQSRVQIQRYDQNGDMTEDDIHQIASLTLEPNATYIFKSPSKNNEFFSCDTNEEGYFISANQPFTIEIEEEVENDDSDDGSDSNSGNDNSGDDSGSNSGNDDSGDDSGSNSGNDDSGDDSGSNSENDDSDDGSDSNSENDDSNDDSGSVSEDNAQQPTKISTPQSDYYLLSVTGSQAHVRSTPSGIDCGYGSGTCKKLFKRGTTVKLEAIEISTASGFSQDDYTIEWSGNDRGCKKQIVNMKDHVNCMVKVYGKQGIDYSDNDNSQAADSSTDNNTVTNQLQLLNFSGHSTLPGGSKNLMLGFILKGDGTADLTFHADILEQGILPELELNEVLTNQEGIYGKLLQRQQQANNFTFNRTIEAGTYTILMNSKAEKGRGMAGVSLGNTTLDMANISVRGYLKDVLVMNFIVSGKGTQKVIVNSHILSGQVSTELHLLNLSTQQAITANPVANGLEVEIVEGVYAVILKVVEGEGIGMIAIDLVK
ncbi:hypothetical protein [Candidatus Albibeggiatoa sp. nov. BB20]|uniref:hypothetical protein n=1 Tax=Candidatus Albibeggiatoa sp. nov. BB20 TaxID=3162723 RepID=UPI0033657C71